MEIEIYQVDAFADELFSGNPAAVCLLDTWLPVDTMQSIALENNLSETVFLVQKNNQVSGYEIRWFTPTTEINLCGHATLAAAHVLVEHKAVDVDSIQFSSPQHELQVFIDDGFLTLDFPAVLLEACAVPSGLLNALGLSHVLACEQTASGDKLVLQCSSSDELVRLQPNFTALAQFSYLGIAVTASDEKVDADCAQESEHCCDNTHDHGVDFVARYFAPRVGVNEDSVTGSMYTFLAPFWAKKLLKHDFVAEQKSARGGKLLISLDDDRVFICGTALTYLKGTIEI